MVHTSCLSHGGVRSPICITWSMHPLPLKRKKKACTFTYMYTLHFYMISILFGNHPGGYSGPPSPGG